MSKKVSKRGVLAEGRPSKYRPEYCEQIVEFMKDGASFVEFASSIGVHSSTFYNWALEFPTFFEAKNLAAEACLAFWERKLRVLACDDVGNASGMIFKLKSFRNSTYSERTELQRRKDLLEMEKLSLEIQRLTADRTDYTGVTDELLARIDSGEVPISELLKYVKKAGPQHR